MPTFVTPDGDLDEDTVNKEFAAAMVAPPADEPTAPAPPRKAASEDAQKAAEPADDAKHDKPRRTSSTGGSGRGRGRGGAKKTDATPPPAEGAYVQPVSEFLQSLTIVGALAPIPSGPLQTRVRLQAHLVNMHAPGLATAIDSAARHNELIRKGVESLTMGSTGWVLPAVLAVAPFAAQSLGLWRADVSEDMVAVAKTFEAEVRDAMMAQAQGEEAAA